MVGDVKQDDKQASHTQHFWLRPH